MNTSVGMTNVEGRAFILGGCRGWRERLLSFSGLDKALKQHGYRFTSSEKRTIRGHYEEAVGAAGVGEVA